MPNIVGDCECVGHRLLAAGSTPCTCEGRDGGHDNDNDRGFPDPARCVFARRPEREGTAAVETVSDLLRKRAALKVRATQLVAHL